MLKDAHQITFVGYVANNEIKQDLFYKPISNEATSLEMFNVTVKFTIRIA